MERRTFGNTDLKVSTIGLGCYGMSGVYGPSDDAEATATIHLALDRGINFLDTSASYGQGHNHRLIGEATEHALLNSHIDLRSDILVKGQNQSTPSGSNVFLDATRPRLIVATSRDFPEYERVSDEWAERVRARGIKLFRQDETGAVELIFRREDWQARAYITGEVLRSSSR